MFAFGKAYHRTWIDRVFEAWLTKRFAAERRLLHAQLATICDTYVWCLLRRQQGLSRSETGHALIEMVTGLLQPAP